MHKELLTWDNLSNSLTKRNESAAKVTWWLTRVILGEIIAASIAPLDPIPAPDRHARPVLELNAAASLKATAAGIFSGSFMKIFLVVSR